MKKRESRIKEHTRYVTMRFTIVEKGEKGYLKAYEARNCDCRNGVIKNGKVWDRLLWSDGKNKFFPDVDILGIFITKQYLPDYKTYQERMGFADAYGNVYIESPTTKRFPCIATGMHNATFGRVGECEDWYEGVFADGACVLVHGAGSVRETIELVDPAASGVYYRHRLFVATQPSGVAYSAPEDLPNFTESLYGAGLIRFSDMGGDVIAMKVFRDKLYLFFESGIIMLENCGDPTDFKTKRITYAGGKILRRTVCVGNSAIFFMSMNGLFRFDGVKVEKLLENFVKLPYEETRRECSAAVGGKVYMRYAPTQDEYITLVAYEDGKDAFCLEDLEGLSASDDGRLYFKEKNRMVGLMGEHGALTTAATFNSEKTNLGILGRKNLRKLIFRGEGYAYLTVICGNWSVAYGVDMSNGCAEIPMSFCGEWFQFNILLPGGTKMEEMTAVVTTARRGA